MKDGSAISQNFVSSNSLVFEALDPIIIVEIFYRSFGLFTIRFNSEYPRMRIYR
jgi:hypothetical protein